MAEMSNDVEMNADVKTTTEPPESTSELSTCTEWSKALPVQAMNHLLQGKRHLLVQDYSSAAASLQEACELYVKFYGQTADECGEVYFYYGKALLELARQETGILGDAVPGGSDEDENKDAENASDDEDEEEDDEQIDSENTNDDNSEMNEANEVDSDQCENVCDSKPSSSTDCEAGPSSSVTAKEEKEEDISTLQLAWEVLEIAKIIFKRQASEDPKVKLRMADILLALGEISMESENYAASIEDLQECLKIHRQYLSPDDRLLAETYFQLGLAYVFDKQFTEGQNSYQNSIDTIKLRISTLQTQDKPVQIADFGVEDPLKEVAELQALLPDLQAKLEDTAELIESRRKSVAEAFQNQLQKSEASISAFVKPVNDISHLLKRKKPDDQDNTKPSEAKKLKMSLPVTNGTSDG